MSSMLYVLIYIGNCAFWGALAQVIGANKNVKGFWWGFFLGIFGLIIVCCLPDKTSSYQNFEDMNENHACDRYEALERLSKLRDNGALTEEEFIKEKEKILK